MQATPTRGGTPWLLAPRGCGWHYSFPRSSLLSPSRRRGAGTTTTPGGRSRSPPWRAAPGGPRCSRGTLTPPAELIPDGTILYLCDAGNHTIRKIVSTSGIVTTLTGTPGTEGYSDNPAGPDNVLFRPPRGHTIAPPAL